MTSDRDQHAHPVGAVRWAVDGAPPLGASCPVCADDAPKARVLTVDTLAAAPRAITLVRCATCGLGFFPDLPEPTPFTDVPEAAALTHFEAANGLRGSVDCLARIDVSGVRRFLEIGCGTGFTLDYVRHVHGWDVLGVDTSVMSGLAGRELGVPVVNGLLGATTAVPDAAWDLVFACEVLEHLTDLAAFLAAVRRAMTSDGVFLLRTPAVEGVTPGRLEDALLPILSPGYHAMLHTRTSLERTLRDAGFTEVHVTREGDTWHAAAAHRPIAWDPDGVLAQVELTAYLRERSATLPAAAPVRLGLAQQLVNLLLVHGDHRAAHAAFEELDAALVARFGHGVTAPAETVSAFYGSRFCAACVARGLLAEADGDGALAEDRYAATVSVGRRVLAGLRDTAHALDPGLEVNVRLAARRLAFLRAASDPEAAADLRADLLDDAAEPALVPGFTELVSRGAHAAAAPLVGPVTAALGRSPSSSREICDARWCLAMLLLHEVGDPAAAAEQFSLAAAEAVNAERAWSSRFHAAYARWHAGDRRAAAPELHAVVAEADTSGGASPATAWAAQARALLAYAG